VSAIQRFGISVIERSRSQELSTSGLKESRDPKFCFWGKGPRTYTEAVGRVKGPMDQILEIPAGNQKS
jgi:hypothetical protein